MKLKIKISLIACIIIGGIFIAILYNNYYNITVYNLNNTSTKNNTTIKLDKETMINIALKDNIVQSYLKNETYNLSEANIDCQYVLFYVGNISSGWEKLLIGINPLNKTTSYVYPAYMNSSYENPQASNPGKEAKIIQVAVKNESVIGYLDGQPYIVKAVDFNGPYVIFDMGDPYQLYNLYVQVDLANNTTPVIIKSLFPHMSNLTSNSSHIDQIIG